MLLLHRVKLQSLLKMLLQLTTIKHLVTIATSVFSSKMTHNWVKRAVDLQYKTTNFLTHAIQKAFDDVSVVTSGNNTANA